MAVISASGNLLPVVDDGDRLVQFELGSLDEVGKVRLEERQVRVPRTAGIRHGPALRRGLAQAVSQLREQPDSFLVVRQRGLACRERTRWRRHLLRAASGNILPTMQCHSRAVTTSGSDVTSLV